MMEDKRELSDVGVIGFSALAQHLILKLNDLGFRVSLFDRNFSASESLADSPAAGRKGLLAANTIDEFVLSLKQPRRVLLILKAGEQVDYFVTQLIPLLGKGDIIIDGSNSPQEEIRKKADSLAAMGLHFGGINIPEFLEETSASPLKDREPDALSILFLRKDKM